MGKPHPIITYLEKTGEKQSDFARRAEISESHLSLIVSGERGMSLGTAVRIEKASGGRIRPSDLLLATATE